MATAIGANIYGFSVGGAVFILQLLLFAVLSPSEDYAKSNLADGIAFLFFGFLVAALIIGLLFWISSVLVVFPAYLIANVLRPPAFLVSLVSAMIAVLPCWWFLDSPGVGSNLPQSLYLTCLSSPAITGAVTGFMLTWLIQKKENKSEMATPKKLSD